RAHDAPAPDAARRALVRARAAGGGPHLRHPAQHQPGTERRDAPGRAERGQGARHRRPGLRARDRAHGDVGQRPRGGPGREHPPVVSRLLEGGSVEAFLLQVLSGLATGGIYASLALAVVMIYKATHLVNFAQGEMAMFSTYIAWQLLQWGM